MTIPDAPTRAKQLAFTDEWLEKFRKLNADKLSPNQRTDLALLVNKLQYDRWKLTVFRDFEWNPAKYNIAQSLNLILNTEYAAKPQRLRTILKRLGDVPAYYQAAQASIRTPTREHTQLAIGQAPGTLVVLAEVGKAAQDSLLTRRKRRSSPSAWRTPAVRCWPGSTSSTTSTSRRSRCSTPAPSVSGRLCTSRSSASRSSPPAGRADLPQGPGRA